MVVFVDIDMYRLVVENQSFFFVCFFLTHMQLVINMDQTHTWEILIRPEVTGTVTVHVLLSEIQDTESSVVQVFF